MLPKERIAAAFEHEPTDAALRSPDSEFRSGRSTSKVPVYQAGFSSRVASALLGREAYVGGGIQQYREAKALWDGPQAHQEFLECARRDAFDLPRVLDLDLVRPSYWRLNEKPTRRLDDCTFFYGDESSSWRVMRFDPPTELYQVVARSPSPPPTLADVVAEVDGFEAALVSYQPQPEQFGDELAALAEFGQERAVEAFGIGLCVPREEIWLEAIALRPDLVRRYLSAQAEYAARNAAALSALGFQYLMGGGDFACKHGPFYSPKAFHDLMLPALQRVSQACHDHGCYHCFASDGDLWPVADDLFGRSGVDCFYEIDRRAGMDLARLRSRFPHLTLMGGISSETLHLGSREQVVAETRSALQAAQEHGSIIVGCSNQIVAPTPIANVEAMLETIRELR